MENGGNLEARVQKLEVRIATVEQILPTLATKDDLKGMPTADDPKGFAMKVDLERFATKDDLKGMPTVDDPKGFAMKADLDRFATRDDLKGMPTVDDPKGFALKADLEHEMHSMREFVREQIGHLRIEMAEDRRRIQAECEANRRASREEMYVLIEVERERWRAIIDQQNRAFERMASIDVESRDRDRALDLRITRLEGQG